MYPTGSSGDLDVTIKEADGSEQHQLVPFASLPVLQREGRLKYSLTSGQYRPYDSAVDKTFFTQGSAIYGLPAGFTAYGGGQLSQHYQSLLVGLGKTLVGWEPYPSMARRPGQPNRIRKSDRPVNACSLQ